MDNGPSPKWDGDFTDFGMIPSADNNKNNGNVLLGRTEGKRLAVLPMKLRSAESNNTSDLLATLLEQGFQEGQARQAVQRCSSIEAAVEFITSSSALSSAASMGGFQCPICMDDVQLETAVSLDCDHKLCPVCFEDYCRDKIGEGRVLETELVCPLMDTTRTPMEACGRAITVEQVGGNVSKQLFNKFLQFRASTWNPSSKLEKIVQCPTPDCCRFVVAKESENAKCPACSLWLCLKCVQKDHPSETCERAASRRGAAAPIAVEDQQFEELMKDMAWQRCPVCTAPTDLAHGCYFMTCQSQQCRGRTFFCYLCGDKLQQKDHMPLGMARRPHFPKGPFNAECNHVSEEEYAARYQKQIDTRFDGEHFLTQVKIQLRKFMNL